MAKVIRPAAFTPRILGFLCQWCGYAGADLAGVSRFRYPPNLRVVRVMCSGRVDAAFIVDAFLRGMDGVMVIGCHPGDCHYLSGNYEAMNMAVATRLLLECSGVNTKRFLLDWVSASEGMRFSRLVSDFTAAITVLGPLGKGSSELEHGLKERLRAALAVAQQEKLRYLLGMFTTFTRRGNRYEEAFTRHEMERVLGGVVLDELATNRILQSLETGPLSVKELAQRLGQPSQRVLRLLAGLKRKGLVVLSSTEGQSPRYALKAGAEVTHVC
ncbi:MAG: hydrogenase iron-sulfur subunit [Chloroflexota bacterium]